MTTFIVMVSIFLILFVIGPKATKRKEEEEKERIEKEHKQKMGDLEEEKIDLDINGTKVRLHKKPKLKNSIYKIKDNG
ncbi:hypothetical protein FC698_14565 [Bacillus cereus]|uniref:hypothetical protein n=1 Tax=Bacillus cereus TaxID=1396 RepID=UPI000BF5EE4D|nr:hypothetical protein [Bacillus cereus]PFT61671.1 hypothetical protein COK67_22260 [Bacillus cereus]TKH47680.1 hypothetical protein FC698_14565 [Bacillus cereus]